MRRKTCKLFIFCAFFLLSLPLAAQITITVTAPVSAGKVLVGATFTLQVRVTSKVAISTVKASVSGSIKTFTLQPSAGGAGAYAGTIDLNGLTEEPWDIEIIAVGVDGSTGSKTFTVTYNKPPKISINYIPNLTIDTTIPLHIITDEPTSITVNYAGTSFSPTPSPFNINVDATPYVGHGITFNIKATDPGGQSAYLDVTTFIDPSPYLDSLTTYTGDILDLDSARVLSKLDDDDYMVTNFVSKKTFRLKGKNILDGQVTLTSAGLIASQANGEIFYGGDSVITNMGPSGVISKAGQYLAWSNGNSFYGVHVPLRVPTITNGYLFANGVGSVTSNGNIVARESATNDPYFLLDGAPNKIISSGSIVGSIAGFENNALFLRSSISGQELVAINYPSGTEKILSASSDAFRVAGDYVVFRQQNFFRYKSGDAEPTQITTDVDTFDPSLRVVNAKGEFIYDVVYNNSNARVVYHRDTLETIGTILGTPFHYGDTWYNAFAGVIYKYDFAITPPILANLSVTMGGEAASLQFTRKMFADVFTNNNPLRKIKIITLPVHGKLFLKQTGAVNKVVEAGYLISAPDLGELIYVPDGGFTGDDTFLFNASNGAMYAQNEATVTIHVPTILGLEVSNDPSLSVYPNPFQSTLNISVADDLPGFNVQVFSIHGRQVANVSCEGTATTMDLQALADGMYVAVVKSHTAIHQMKIIKGR